MGVSATASTFAFFLTADRLADACRALHDLAEREPEEFHDAAAVAKAKGFADALVAGGWRSTADAAGNIVEIRFAGGKAPKGSSDLWPLPMFRTLAPLFAAAIVEVSFDGEPSTYVLLGSQVERWHDEPRNDAARRKRDAILKKARALVAAARKRAKAPPVPKATKATKRRAAKADGPPKRAPVRRAVAPSCSGPRIGMALDMAAEDDLQWHREVRLVAALVAALDPNDLWLDFDCISVQHEDPVRLDRRRLAKLIADWEHGNLELRASEDADAPHFGIHTGGVLADVRMYTPRLDPSRKGVIDGMIGLARAASSLAGDRALVRDGCIYPLEPMVELPEPEREHPLIRLGTLVDFIGVRWCEERMPELLTSALEGELPAGASRQRHGDLLVLRWIEDPTDAEQHGPACLRQQSWWVEQFPPRSPH